MEFHKNMILWFCNLRLTHFLNDDDDEIGFCYGQCQITSQVIKLIFHLSQFRRVNQKENDSIFSIKNCTISYEMELSLCTLFSQFVKCDGLRLPYACTSFWVFSTSFIVNFLFSFFSWFFSLFFWKINLWIFIFSSVG